MVYNSVRHVQLPNHKAASLHALSAYHKNMNFIKGAGMGSVLLRTGGPGGGSSYSDIDEYISQTGINPYTRVNVKKGKGLPSKFNEKLSRLNIAPPSMDRPRKNIIMNM